MTRPVDPPYSGMGVLWDSPRLLLWSGLAAVPWMASVIAGPVLVWRSIARTGGTDRRRALVVAVVSVVPIATIVFCVLSAVLVYALDILPESVGEAGLGLAFGAPFVLCAAGLAWGSGAAPARLVSLPPARVGRVMSVAVGLSFAIVVISISAVVGEQVGAGGPLPVVIGTLVVAAVLAPLRRRLVRTMLLRADPGRASAAVLVHEARGGRSEPGRTAQRILRTAVGDPSARLVLGLPGGAWVDVDGVAVDQPRAGPGSTPLDRDDERPAYLLHTTSVIDAAGPLDEVRALVDHAVLEAAVRDQAARLVAERDRAEEAAATERRRLERDLHDGVQGRLLALALDLRMAQRDLADASAQLVLSDAASALASAIDELRSLAAGETPELLSRQGLQAALVELTHRMPVPVTVRTPPDRLPPGAETVAYLVACEGITNAIKHAAATQVTVDVTIDEGVAVVLVSDDGRGGADLRAGTGLRGLAERVGGVGGTLVVSDRRPKGTALEVTIPCGS